jgi:hypothetical protein
VLRVHKVSNSNLGLGGNLPSSFQPSFGLRSPIIQRPFPYTLVLHLLLTNHSTFCLFIVRASNAVVKLTVNKLILEDYSGK